MKRMVLLTAVVAVLSAWMNAPAHSANKPFPKMTADQSVLRRHAALARLGMHDPRPAAPTATRFDRTVTFAWTDATLGCAAGIASTGLVVFLYRRAKRRPAAA